MSGECATGILSLSGDAKPFAALSVSSPVLYTFAPSEVISRYDFKESCMFSNRWVIHGDDWTVSAITMGTMAVIAFYPAEILKPTSLRPQGRRCAKYIEDRTYLACKPSHTPPAAFTDRVGVFNKPLGYLGEEGFLDCPCYGNMFINANPIYSETAIIHKDVVIVHRFDSSVLMPKRFTTAHLHCVSRGAQPQQQPTLNAQSSSGKA